VPVTGAAVPGPVAEEIRPGKDTLLAPCDATASGAEEGKVRVARGLLVLDLCGHHFDRYQVVLLISGWRVTHDNRPRGPVVDQF
jgi:hypothetical protein